MELIRHLLLNCVRFSIRCSRVRLNAIMIPVVLSVLMRAAVEAQNCFGGVETFEKTSVTDFDGTILSIGTLLHQENVALTRDCINLCKQQSNCQSFSLNYAKFKCSAYPNTSKRLRDRIVHSPSNNFYERMCLNGISRQSFDAVCGHDRLWAFERVKNSFLDGFVDDEMTNVGSKEECAKACLMKSSFICRSADYDESERVCRMSKEDRRTQPQAFRQVPGSSRDYLENQCAAPGPSSCVYSTKPDFAVLSMDSLHFATTSDDCQTQCDQETSFNCRSFSFLSNRCVLSGDDGVSLVGTSLPAQKGATYGERTCLAELCTNGIFTYEKITGYVLRSAVTTAVELPNPGSLGATGWCRQSCDSANLGCPAFSINYQSSRCEKLDRNSQGRTGDLIPREGESYFEKICLRVPQIKSMCQDKYWSFERVLGYELAPVLYTKTLSFVQSRRDCEEYCMQEREFPCRSALYNDETTECKLSKEDRRTAEGMYYRSRSLKINYLENQCVRTHTTCPFEQTLDGYPTYTDLVETNGVSSHEVCEKYCNDNSRFLCRSYAYYSSNGQCFISGDDRSSAGGNAIQKRSGIVYFERQCPKYSSTGSTSATQTTSKPTSSPAVTFPSSAASPSSSFPNIPTPPAKDPPPGNNNRLSPPFEPFVTPRHASSDPNQSIRPLEIPRALETDLNNVHSVNGITSSPSSKCGPHSRYVFEKVTSFEPIGGQLTLLYTDLQNPGIVTECARRCEASSHCRAFVVDYFHQSCHALLENSSVGNLDLRLSVGKDYFEGFCVPMHVDCGKFWPFDRILDQSSIGAQPQEKIKFISRAECRKKCLEERKFKCLSASFDSTLHECRLYSEDRNSGAITLLFTRGTDYMENQCNIETSICKYHPIERDISIVPVTKSVKGTSTFHCEQACDLEKEFNCRSYTYLDSPDGPSPGGNLCLLSSDNRATSHQGSMQFRPRALYAEKDCVNYRTSRAPSTHFTQPSFPQPQPVQPTFIAPIALNSVTSSPQTHDSLSQLLHVPASCASHQYTFEKTFGRDFRFARRERAPIPPRLGIVIHCQDECIRRGDRCKAFIVEYGPLQSCYFLDEAAGENRNHLQSTQNTAYVEKICLRERTCGKLWTFERMIGYNLLESADKEIPSVILRTDCEDLCLAEKTFVCKSATYDYTQRICKLFSETRRSRPSSFQTTTELIDYVENQCVNEPSTCQYRDMQDSFFPFIDRLTSAFSLADCQRQCDGERMFPCRSMNYETFARDCGLSSEDSVTLGMGPSGLVPRRHSVYSEKGNCEQVSVQCNQQDMVLTLNFDSPFNGRVYAKGNPSQCFVVGTGQTNLQFAVSLGSRCGTRKEGTNNFANEVVVQQHAVIMTDSDRTIRVLCSFETSDQTVTLSNPNPVNGKPGGIDVTALMNARTRLEQPITSVVTNTAPPPAVMMRIQDRSQHDAQIVGLGDELTLRIELKDPASAFALFARNLYARSSSGESLFLIDGSGCPTDPAIFPALTLDLQDRRSLSSTFKAFRFPSTGVVNFEVQIRFCQDKCEPIKCSNGFESYGKRRRRREINGTIDEQLNETDSLRQDDSLHPILVHPRDETILAITKKKRARSTTPDINESTIIETFTELITEKTPKAKSRNRNRKAIMEENSIGSNVTTMKAEPLPIPQEFKTQPISPSNQTNQPESPVLQIVSQAPISIQHIQSDGYNSAQNNKFNPNSINTNLHQSQQGITHMSGRVPPMYPQDYTRYGDNRNGPLIPSASQPIHPSPTPISNIPFSNPNYNNYHQYNNMQQQNYPINNQNQNNYASSHWNRRNYPPYPDYNQQYNQHQHQQQNLHQQPLSEPNRTLNNNYNWQMIPKEIPHQPYYAPTYLPYMPAPYYPTPSIPSYMQQQPHYYPQQVDQVTSPTPFPTAPTRRTTSTRPPLPPSYLEWGNSKKVRPSSRTSSAATRQQAKQQTNNKSAAKSKNKIIQATTQKPQPQEVPLSLAIMVGDEKENPNWKQNNAYVQSSSSNVTPIEECSDCNTALTMFYTALVVSFIHIGLITGAYFYISKFKYVGAKMFNGNFAADDEIAGIHQLTNGNVNSVTPISSNSNVFYGNREFGFRSINGIPNTLNFGGGNCGLGAGSGP